MNSKRKILAVTGARSEYDILFPILERLNADEAFDLGIIVTGAHLSATYGNTIKNIESDGFTILKRISNLVERDRKIDRIISLGNQIVPLAEAFEEIEPDIVLVVGDREEAISVSITAAYMDIAVAHIAGGDIAKDGNIDNSVRYATSKFAHIHFTILPEHRQTLLKLGEDDWRIHVVGNPALDRFVSTPLLTREELSQSLSFDITADKYCVLIQHPIITEVEETEHHINQTLEAIHDSGLKCFINYPNSDAGNHAIIRAYEKASEQNEKIYLFKNMNRLEYVNVLRHAACLIGNSSSGIIEAPSFNLPVVNVGSRQRGRVQAGNVIFVDYNKNEILSAIEKSINDQKYILQVNNISNPYGDGHSAEKIVSVLKSVQLSSELIHKNITY